MLRVGGKRRRDRAQRRRARSFDRSHARVEVLARRGSRELASWAAAQPLGPAFISSSYDEDAHAPVVLVVTRVAPSGHLVPALALVDRGAVGVKDHAVYEPMGCEELEALLALVSAPAAVRRAPVELVQSVLFHAIDFAGALGFDPAPDFPLELFSPRPEPLLPTRGARPARPVFVPGPRDDVARVRRDLERACGVGGYDIELGAVHPSGFEAEQHVTGVVMRLVASG